MINMNFIVGGIYTVLRSKAESTVNELGEDYYMLGVCNERFVAMEVEKMELTLPSLMNTVQNMKQQQIGVSMPVCKIFGTQF